MATENGQSHLRQRSTAAAAAAASPSDSSASANESSAMLATSAASRRGGKNIADPADVEEIGLLARSRPEIEDVGAGKEGANLASGNSWNGANGEEKEHPGGTAAVKPELSQKDKKAIALLVVLYLLQGVPVGLAFGTMPYLLKSRLSYSDIGIFMLCTYPYSLKLLWSPIVDSCFVESARLPLIGQISLGRRKSWIVPIQAIVGIMLWFLGTNVDRLLLADIPDVNLITLIFFVLVLFAATQDIAVDGWALTLLSQENLSYASTAQTIGLNSGYFLSFTVFLAFNSVEFGNKYFRDQPLDYPLLSLSGYLKFWAVAFLLVTAWLLFAKKEDSASADDPDMDIKKVYSIMYRICKLKHVQSFILVHLVAKIGFQANEAVTGLKLVEKGFGKEDLALAVLIDFPFQIVFGYLAARWSKGENALRPWIWAFVGRLGFAIVSMGIVKSLPLPPIGTSFFILVITSTVLSSFASTVQFVGISAFHTQIADPLIGGTYMTLLNTVSNLGGTWPRYFVLKGVDYFTLSSCVSPSTPVAGVDKLVGSQALFSDPGVGPGGKGFGGAECTSDVGKAACAAIGGHCVIERDGYYWTSSICVALGAILLVGFIIPTCRRLQRLPPQAWRVNLYGRD